MKELTKTNENRNIGISFGIISDSLCNQLDAQGFKYDKKTIEAFEVEIDAINTLRFGSQLLTDSMVNKIIPKLYKKIVAHVAKINKLSIVK